METKWKDSSFAKSRERSIRRKKLSDFERFKVMKLRKSVSSDKTDGTEEWMRANIWVGSI